MTDESRPAADRSRRRDWDVPVILCLVAVTGIGLLLRTQQLVEVGLNFDECCSWKISQFPWNEMLDAVSRDAHPPVYYTLMKGLGSVAGESVEVIRGFSVFFGLATIVAAWFFVRTALSDHGTETGGQARGDERLIGILAAALVATSALHVEMSMQGRPYTLGTFLALVSGVFALRAVSPRGTYLDWCSFTIATTLLSLTHYYGMFSAATLYLFVIGAVVTTLCREGWGLRTRRQLAGAALSLWGLQLAWSSWLPVFAFQRGRSTPQLWMSPLDWQGLAANCWLAIGGGQSAWISPEWSGIAVAAWGGIALILCVCAGFAGEGRRTGMLLAAMAAALPLAATVAYSLLVRNILGAKYLIFGQVYLLMAAALLIGRLPWRIPRVAIAVALVGWNGYWCWQQAEFRDRVAAYPGVQGAVHYLEDRRQPGEPVVVGSPFFSIIVQKYATRPEGIYVQYGGDHRSDMLGGPPLRDEEYRDLQTHLALPVQRVWVIDVFEMFRPGSRFEVSLPSDFRLLSQEEFRDVGGVLAVREYRRQAAATPQQAAASMETTNIERTEARGP